MLPMKNNLSNNRFFKKAVLLGIIAQLFLVLIMLFFTTTGLMSMNTLDYIIGFLNVVLAIAMIVGIVVSIICGVKNRKLPKNELFFRAGWPIGLVVFMSFMMLILSFFFKYEVRKEVRNLLGKLSLKTKVMIDGKMSNKPQSIIEKLKKVTPLLAHRSHDINRINIVIEDGDKKININMGRDSENPDEYWIYYPKYKYSTKQEVGRIRTSLFDDY